MLSEYEYAQAVMKAAGVVHDKQCNCCACAGCSGLAHCTAVSIYPDPLTSAEGFLALWDALVAKDLLVRAIAWNTSAGEKSTFICIEGENWRADSDNEDIKVALVEAAGQALGVTR